MGCGKDVNEELETSWWDLGVDVTNLSNEGVTGSNVDGLGKLWSFVDSDLVRCFGSWKHGQEEVLGLKKNEEGNFGGDVEDDVLRRQCEEEKNCPKVECPKVASEVNEQWRESEVWCDDVWIGGTWIGGTGCDDEKVNEDDGEEGEKQGQQSPKLEVALWLWEEDEIEQEWEWVPMSVVDDEWTPYRQRESEKQLLRDQQVEVLETM
eukprot:s1938_g10.t1